MKWISYIPKSYLSWFVGFWANLPLPQPFAKFLISWFVRSYKIDPSWATRPPESFRSIGEFFTRDLKPELRPISEGIVCPVDGTLRSASGISDVGTVVQVKGIEYKVSDLLGNDPLADRFTQGQLWNFYLSPQDAHHIHSPVDGEIVKTVHIPGKLWPVNDWAFSAVDGLFAVNERIVTFIESKFGLVAVVMVGATNVGRIALSYASIETNTAPWKKHTQQALTHAPTIPVQRGAKVGTFKMGSSVVLVFERKPFEVSGSQAPAKVTYGSALDALCRA
jgi:phosphatidylserine decarboxylase